MQEVWAKVVQCVVTFLTTLTWPFTEQAAHLGEFLTGIAAILALALAPTGLKRWRREKHLEKAAEVAQLGYSRLSRFLEAIRFISSPFTRGGEPLEGQPDDIEPFRDIFYDRAKQAEKDIQDFLTAWPDVEALLPEEAAALFKEAWDHWASIKGNFETFCLLYRQGADDRAVREQRAQFWERSLGNGVRTKIDQIKVKAKEVFIPLAQFNW